MQQYDLFAGIEMFKVLRVVQEVQAEYLTGNTLDTPEKVAAFCHAKVGNYANEVFGVIFLDNKHKPTGWGIVGQGTINTCPAEPRQIFTPALLSGAAAVILFHNHPSADTNASRADIKLTEQLRKAGELLNITVLDHIIVGSEGAFMSFRRDGLL